MLIAIKCFIFILLIQSVSGRATSEQYFTGTGHSVAGSLALSGIMKRLVIPNALPIGKLASYYGYEVWDFSNAKESVNGHNRVSFCFSSVEFNHDMSVVGFAFGGEAAVIKPVGQCPKNLDVAEGEDLMFTIAFDVGKGAKSIPLGVSFSYGFNMEEFLSKMNRHFINNNEKNISSARRMLRLHGHILKYLALKEAKKVSLSPLSSILLKLFTASSLLSSKDAIKDLKISKNELDFISKIASRKVTSFKTELGNSLNAMKRDADFYFCADFKECEELYLDFMVYSENLINAMEDCHTLAFTAALQTDYSISLTPGNKFEVSFGYVVTDVDKIFTSQRSTKVLAMEKFATHNFTKHSEECGEVTSRAGRNFGNFLRFLGYGKK
jgi:hypothetical protein